MRFFSFFLKQVVRRLSFVGSTDTPAIWTIHIKTYLKFIEWRWTLIIHEYIEQFGNWYSSFFFLSLILLLLFLINAKIKCRFFDAGAAVAKVNFVSMQFLVWEINVVLSLHVIELLSFCILTHTHTFECARLLLLLLVCLFVLILKVKT